jgi:hypothetical protein
MEEKYFLFWKKNNIDRPRKEKQNANIEFPINETLFQCNSWQVDKTIIKRKNVWNRNEIETLEC